MPILSSNILLYGSANMPADDTSTAGGAVSLSTRVVFDDLPSAGTVRLVGTDAGDTSPTYQVSGKNAAGADVSEVLTLNGTTPAAGAVSFERIRKLAKTGGSALAGTAVLYRATSTAVNGDSPNGQTLL